MATEAGKLNLKRMPKGAISLMFAGDLILAKCKNREYIGLFRRYEAIFEKLANMPKEERVLNYLFLNALMLTSYAKKSADKEQKKHLFDLKNKIFIGIAKNKDLRRQVQFSYLSSKNFRVIEYCKDCIESNSEKSLDKHNWKYCRSCQVDRNFYNIIAMSHKFTGGKSCIFLSHDQAKQLGAIKFKNRLKLGEIKEEAQLDQYHYNTKNLDAIEFDSVMSMFDKIVSKAI